MADNILSPVRDIPNDNSKLEQGLALCLSGGGYRAMLFHVGTLLRLNELGVLPQLDRVSSVSGGSITAGVLAMNWNRLRFVDAVATNLKVELCEPVQRLADETIDVAAVGWGSLNPFKTIGEVLSGYYDRYVFGNATLQDIPDQVRFIFNATSVQTGALWRFSKPYMGDYNVGLIMKPVEKLSVAVAASSAFPPVLSPVELSLNTSQYDVGTPAEFTTRDYRERVILTDGGVYDNLGLETAWKRYTNIIVSDGGRKMAVDPEPNTDWALQSRNLIDLLQHQTSNLRRRQAIESFKSGMRGGCYFGIQTELSSFDTINRLLIEADKQDSLAKTPTRLAAMDRELQALIMNLGYAVCDAAIRCYKTRWIGDIEVLTTPPRFPF